MQVTTIDRKKLVENSYNPRKRFDTAQMKELETSLNEVGFMQPLLVRPLNGGKYEVVAGMRRFKASEKIKEIPCYIREMSEQEAKKFSIIENLERAKLTPIEEAKAFADYLGWIPKSNSEELPNFKPHEMSKKIEEFANELPMSAKIIKNRLNLLELPEKVQIMLENNELTITEAESIGSLRQLLSIRKKSLPKDITDKIIKTKIKQEFVPEIHQKMEERALFLVKKEPNSRKREITNLQESIENILHNAKLESNARTQYIEELQEKFESAKTNLIEFLTGLREKEDLEFDFSFDENSVLKDSQNLYESLRKKMGQLGDANVIISKKRTHENNLDRMELAKKYIKEEIKDYCPFCGAGIQMSNLNRRISEQKDIIEDLNEQENEIADENKLLNKTTIDLDKLIKEHNHRQQMLETGILDQKTGI